MNKTKYAFGQTINGKIQCIIILFSTCLLIIVVRLFYLQIIAAPRFIKQGKNNFLRIEKTISPRGNILDRNGFLLVTNRPLINLYWQGTGNTNLHHDQKNVLEHIESITEKSFIQDKLNTLKHHEKRNKKVMLAYDISLEQLTKIEELFPNHPNISISTDFKRYYPYQSVASHIVGYLGRFDIKMIGKMGLEKMFEEVLQGQDGQILKTINSFGAQLSQTEVKQALSGQHVQTTLDLPFQQLAEDIFPAQYNGTWIIMDPQDGSILTLVSRPNFDPTIFLQPISTEQWLALQEKKPFLNRAFNACYPPGSIFKLVTISAALEQHITTTDAQWTCNGYTQFGGRKYWCHRHYGHGELNTHQAVAQSCNIMFYQLAKQIDIDLLADYAHRFGLGHKANNLFPEKYGLIPTKTWKKEAIGERWWPGETLSAVIGQSYLLVTPIQVARMISSIFTGNLVTPRILSSEPIHQEQLNIKPETIQFLQRSMRAVVTKGTGRHVSKIKDIKIHAKTSTAQTSTKHKRHLGTRYKEHGWFVAHFRYKNQKPLTMVLLVEHAGSSRVATRIAKTFLLKYKDMMDKKYPNTAS